LRKLRSSVRAAMSQAGDKPNYQHQVFHKLNAVNEGNKKDQKRYLRRLSSTHFIV